MSYVELAEQGYKLKFLDDLTPFETRESLDGSKLIVTPFFKSNTKVERVIKSLKPDLEESEFDVLRLLFKYCEQDKYNQSKGYRIMTLKIIHKIANELNLTVRTVKDIILGLDEKKYIDLFFLKKLKQENFNRRFTFTEPSFKSVYEVSDYYIVDKTNDSYYILKEFEGIHETFESLQKGEHPTQ